MDLRTVCSLNWGTNFFCILLFFLEQENKSIDISSRIKNRIKPSPRKKYPSFDLNLLSLLEVSKAKSHKYFVIILTYTQKENAMFIKQFEIKDICFFGDLKYRGNIYSQSSA